MLHKFFETQRIELLIQDSVFSFCSGFVLYFRFFVSFDRLIVFRRVSPVEHVFCGTAGGVPCVVLYID